MPNNIVIAATHKIHCLLYTYLIAFVFLFQVYTWGCNDEGALGRMTSDGEEYFPGLVESINKVKIVQISAGTV